MSGAQLALLIVGIVALLVAAAAVAFVVVRRRRAAERARRAPHLPRWPIVLVHGLVGFDALLLAGGRQYFRGIVTHLEARGLTVYRPQLPGVGSVPVRAGKLADFIRSLPDEKVNVIAHSMAGLDA